MNFAPTFPVLVLAVRSARGGTNASGTSVLLTHKFRSVAGPEGLRLGLQLRSQGVGGGCMGDTPDVYHRGWVNPSPQVILRFSASKPHHCGFRYFKSRKIRGETIRSFEFEIIGTKSIVNFRGSP